MNKNSYYHTGVISAVWGALILSVLGLVGCSACLISQEKLCSKDKSKCVPELHAKTLLIDTISINYADTGSGECILLIHGFPETMQSWASVVPLLSSRYRVIAIDLPGVGRSGKPRITYTPEILSSLIHHFLEMLHVSKIHLVGTDTGVMVAVALAGGYPDLVESLILSAGTIHVKDMTSWEIPLLRTPLIGEIILSYPFRSIAITMSLMKGFHDKRFVTKDLYEECIRSYSTHPGRYAGLSMIRNFTLSENRLSVYLAPLREKKNTLVIFGSNDAWFPLCSGKRLSLELGGSFVVIPKCGHFLQQEKPQEYVDAITSFLNNRPAGLEGN